MRPVLLFALISTAALVAATGCDDGGADADVDGDADADAHGDGDADADADGDADADSDGDADVDADEDDGGVVGVWTCADPPPPGAALPDPLPFYSEGVCPALAAGRNVLASGGHDREFILVVPAGYDPSEELPLIFMWHWLGGEADDFLERGEVQPSADSMRFLAAIPEARGDQLFRWPFLDPPLVSNARRDEELTFFDDMLACVAEQFSVNESCVSSIGVSAGGLWTSHLAQRRSTRLASFLSLSGAPGRRASG